MTTRRRLFPWAIGLAVLILAATLIAAAMSGGESTAAPTTTPSNGTGGTEPVTTQGELTAGLATDEPAPNFDAATFEGTVFLLDDHFATDGRPVLLNLWASWCFPCREEMPALDAVAANHPEVLFIGVAVEDDPNEAEKFAEEIGVDYLLTIDESDEVSELYPALGLPATFLISEDRRVVAKLFGGASEETFEEFLLHLGS